MKTTKRTLISLLCLFLLASTFTVSASAGGGVEPQENQLTVSGSYTVVAVADEAYVTIGVKTNNVDYKKCQAENKEKMNSITAAIKALGIQEKYIKTIEYNSVPIYEYEKTEEYTGVYYNGSYYNKRVFKEYQLTHLIRVMLTDVSLVGKLVDITVENGVNEMNNVAFALSKPKEHELYLQALEGASGRAKDKAAVLAKAFGIGTLKIKNISTDYYMPYSSASYNYAAPTKEGFGGAMASDGANFTTITSGEIQVTATVNILYTY